MRTVENELEKLDAIRSRMKVSYEEARTALEGADGDVVQALINLEKREGDLLATGIELLDDVQKLVQAGGASRVRVKFADKVVGEYPVAFTAAAAFVVGLAAVLITKSSIEIEREESAPEEEQPE
jgi:hypothetical protein